MVGEAARKLFADGKAMLKKIIEGRWLRANGVFGLFPAARVGDDIEIYADESRKTPLMVWHNLRQQNQKPTGRANQCLADFVAPRESGVADYIGAFAVTAGLGIEKRVAAFEQQHDDYSAIMLKALADRLAEAFAELLHQRVRREFWGYAPRRGAGQRRADRREIPRHPPGARLSGLPRPHREGRAVRAAARRSIDMRLTESFAMLPAAAVSGFYFSHPQSQYFAVGKIDRDQVEDYARRKGMSVADAERWLAPVLGYNPA